MTLSEILNNKNVKIGIKQSSKAVLLGKAMKVFIAADAEEHVVRRLIILAKENDVEIEEVSSMEELGKACNIDVGAATAVIIK